MTTNFYYGHGKVLLSSEYYVLDGAKALALPTNLGQTMRVTSRPSNNPILHWKSFDSQNKLWLEVKFELWHFDILENDCAETKILQTILRFARKQNIHFLREDNDFVVETHVEFPLNWGLGSSSTLLYNISQWAYVSPFELQSQVFGGSGYDIACAQATGPIVYKNKNNSPSWEGISFSPLFKDKLFFLYLNKKQKTNDAISFYKSLDLKDKSEVIGKLNHLTNKMIDSISYNEFEECVYEHETIISSSIGLKRLKDEHFSDYWGAVKSLGAWGGDFALVCSNRSFEETAEYFKKQGFESIFTFDDMIRDDFENVTNRKMEVVRGQIHTN